MSRNDKKAKTLRSLKQYWQYLSSSIKKTFKTHVHPSPSPDELEREISAISSANQTLADTQEELRQEMAAARSKDGKKLAELERVKKTLETIRQDETRKFDELENRLDEIESERNLTRDQVKVLKDSLVETSTQLRKTDYQLKALQDGFMEQAKAFETALSRAATRLETTDNQVRKLELDQRQSEKTFLETLAQLHTQGRRIMLAMMVAGIAVVLAAMSGAILIRDANKNAILLASMNDDIKHLLSSMDQHLNTTHQAVADRPSYTAIETPDKMDEDRAVTLGGAAAVSHPTIIPEELDDAPGDSATHAYLPGSTPDALYSPRKDSSLPSGVQKKPFTRTDADNQVIGSLPGGMQYRVVTPGRGRLPEITDRVVVDYLAVTPDGNVIDDTYSSGQSATLHMSEVAPALQEVLLNMEEGAEWEVTVPRQQPYDSTDPKRRTHELEPGIYLIELVEVIEGYASGQPMPPE